MKLIFIYGPPASGKLTTAKELAKLTGYKVFHNHLSFDLVNSVFEFGDKVFLDLMEKIRIMLFKAALKENIKGLIFTFAYANPEDDDFIKRIVKLFKKHNGQIYFVRIFCIEKTLYKRVINKSRKKFGKVTTKKGLHKVTKKWNLFSKIPFEDSLQIDNTGILPKKVAKMIVDHYKI
jgi:hypothetical protein